MNGEIWGALVRQVLTLLGGFFVAKGYVDGDSVSAIAGAASTLASTGWSIANKQSK
jgi:fumarate reductase subunit D